MDTTFDLDECASFLKVHTNTVMELASTGELQGAKIGRAWVFLKSDCVAYLREKIDSQVKERRRMRQGLPAQPQTAVSPTNTSKTVLQSRRGRAARVLPQLPG